VCLQVKQSRMQLFPLFEDYDRVHNGTVSASQFRRVLDELKLAGLLPTELDWVAISTAFAAVVGGKIDVDYTKFCDAVYAIAGFEWRKP
jgi:Ca2+-binding EF-hand superfamily protein